MSSEIAIRVSNISKCYHIYDSAQKKLLQILRGNRKKYYREFWALKDISFEIKKGQTVGIIGCNGSGKSTLLQIICGTLKPTTGNIEIRGRVAALLELGSGFNPEFSGRENVYLNASLLGLSKAQIDSRFSDMVDFADIGDFIDQPVKTYSSGMMLRLAFAVIAHVDANILIIDEALAVGDVFFTQKCMRFLRGFIKTGTVLFVSHDTNSIKNLCDYALWLDKGQVIQEGQPKAVCELYLEAYYESQQGKSTTTKLKKIKMSDESIPLKDQRLEFINHSNLRNDLQVFKFDPDAASFGKGKVQIQDVRLLDKDKQTLAWIVGGEQVTLRITANVHEPFYCPIVGFLVKDRLGQVLFGDNTFLTYREKNIDVSEGDTLQADFVFYMPLLPPGDYSIAVAIANGSHDLHEQQHWIHDAIVFKSEASSIVHGLVGIPMQEITLKSITDDTLCSTEPVF